MLVPKASSNSNLFAIGLSVDPSFGFCHSNTLTKDVTFMWFLDRTQCSGIYKIVFGSFNFFFFPFFLFCFHFNELGAFFQLASDFQMKMEGKKTPNSVFTLERWYFAQNTDIHSINNLSFNTVLGYVCLLLFALVVHHFTVRRTDKAHLLCSAYIAYEIPNSIYAPCTFARRLLSILTQPLASNVMNKQNGNSVAIN